MAAAMIEAACPVKCGKSAAGFAAARSEECGCKVHNSPLAAPLPLLEPGPAAWSDSYSERRGSCPCSCICSFIGIAMGNDANVTGLPMPESVR